MLHTTLTLNTSESTCSSRWSGWPLWPVLFLGVANWKSRQRLQDDSLSHKAIRRINRHHQERKRSIIESFFEMVFASTSVLIFLSLYYVIDERIPGVSIYWQKYQDIILLLFLCFSVILNGWAWYCICTIGRNRFQPEGVPLRLVSSFYIILILLYIKFIYNDDNISIHWWCTHHTCCWPVYYFDFTMDDFLSTLHGFWEELPLLILMASYSGFVCWFGFYTGFLLTSNGVIVSTLLAHLFMVCSFLYW